MRTVAGTIWSMRHKLYVYDYDNEPSDERPTGFGETNFGHSGVAALSTTSGAWFMSQQSTFDEPSRAAHRVQAYRKHNARRHAGLIGVVLLALAVVAAALALARYS
jgi:hypothetical protein